MRIGIVIILLGMLCTNVFAEPAITNLTISADAARIEWDALTNRFILAETSDLTSAWRCTASGNGSAATGITVPYAAATTRFYRVYFDLLVADFSDPLLAIEARKSITAKHDPTNCLYDADFWGVTTLTAASKGISNLTGVAVLRDLTSLFVQWNQITNMSALAVLNKLTALSLHGNLLTSFDSTGLDKLQLLYLGSNELTDLAFASSLTNLVQFYAPYNQLSDLAPLASLLNLTRLDLQGNNITDLFPLLLNSNAGGLGAGDAVYLNDNPLSAWAVTVQIPALRSNGVYVTGF